MVFIHVMNNKDSGFIRETGLDYMYVRTLPIMCTLESTD